MSAAQVPASASSSLRRVVGSKGNAHVLQPPDYIHQRVSRLAGWLGHTVTSVMYGIGIEAVGAVGPSRPENCEKLRLRVVAMPLRTRHAARWVFIACHYSQEPSLVVEMVVLLSLK